MFSFFKKPYPSDISLNNGIKSALLVSLFMIVFFMIFKPFGLGNLSFWPLFKVVCMYASINAISTFLVLYLFRFLFPSFYNEDKWTVGHQSILFFFLLFFIALGCFAVNVLIKFMPFHIKSFLWLSFYVISFGILPIGFSIMRKYNVQLKKNLKEAQSINTAISSEIESDSIDPSVLISFHSDNKKEKLELKDTQFLYGESDGNYVTIHFLNEKKETHKKMIRTTLKTITSDVSSLKHIIRCHRSFIVNINMIQQINGDSRGYEISLKENEDIVPVSRSYISTIKACLNIPK